MKPGEEATAEVRIRNKSNVVDQYDIKVVGEPSRWTIAEPTTLSLFRAPRVLPECGSVQSDLPRFQLIKGYAPSAPGQRRTS